MMKAWRYEEGVLTSDELTKIGVVHGFCGSVFDFRPEKAPTEWERMWRDKTAPALLLLKQEHGTTVFRVPLEFDDFLDIPGIVHVVGQGDALILGRDKLRSRVAIAVRTADCVPIIVATQTEYAVIHAGWRGLAKEIIPTTLAAMKVEASSKVFAAIGPAAGKLSYEVGQEVASTFEQYPEALLSRAGGYFLDLVSVAKSQIERSLCGCPLTVHTAPICTMTDERFHSYRRWKQRRGRCQCHRTAH